MIDLSSDWGPEADDADGEADEASQGRLAPLPSRVGVLDEQTGLDRPVGEVIDQLLERATVLLSTLDHDVAGLVEDQEAERIRIESERAHLREQAEHAIEELGALRIQAERIAAKKGKQALLAQGADKPARVEGTLDFRKIRSELLTELKAAPGITGAMRLPRIGELLALATIAIEQLLDRAEHLTRHKLDETENELDADSKEARASFEIGSMVLNRDLVAVDLALGPPARPWGSPSWADWRPAGSAELETLVRLGGHVHPELDGEIPLLWTFPGDHGLLFEAGPFREQVIDAVQSLALRVLAACPPGAVRLSVIDPRGLGESAALLAALATFDAGLIDGGAATTSDAIEERLTDLARHIERVNQQYLRGRFATLAECNAAAGDVVEPYRLLLVFDHPNSISEESAKLLAAIVESGPRCGVIPIVTKDAQPASAYAGPWGAPTLEGLASFQIDADGHWLETPHAGRWALRFDRPPRPGEEAEPAFEPEGADEPRVEVGPVDSKLLDRLITTIGGGALASRDRTIALDKVLGLAGRSLGPVPSARGISLREPVDPTRPETWWQLESTPGVGTPIGRSGGAEAAWLWLDSDTQPNLLIAGGESSGVSNALTAAVLGLSLTYAPEELELYLVATQRRGGFAEFGSDELPHARLVATYADPELVASVVDQLSIELDRRLDLLRATVGERAGIEGLRNDAGVPMSRIVLMIDDLAGTTLPGAAGRELGAKLNLLVRLGPRAGMHLVSGLRSPDIGVVPEVVFRQRRANLLLGGSRPIVEHLLAVEESELDDLHLPGEAVLVNTPGDLSGATRLRTAFVDPAELDLCLRDLRHLADERECDRRPRVIVGDRTASLEARDLTRLVGETAERERRKHPRLLIGEPVGIGDPVEVLLRRQEGANLMAITEDPDMGQGVLLAGIVSAAFVHGPSLATMALDFMPMDAGFSEALQILGQGPWTMQVARRRSMHKVFDVMHRIVVDRHTTGDSRGKPVLFVLNGLARARDLEPGAAVEPGDLGLGPQLEVIARDGPEVGVHTLAWCDTVAALGRRLSPAAVSEFAIRVGGAMDAESSLTFLDTEQAAALQPNQALLYDEEQGRSTKFIPYESPGREWLLEAVRRATPA